MADLFAAMLVDQVPGRAFDVYLVFRGEDIEDEDRHVAALPAPRYVEHPETAAGWDDDDPDVLAAHARWEELVAASPGLTGSQTSVIRQPSSSSASSSRSRQRRRESSITPIASSRENQP
jgi:hypothetical protein